MFYFAQKGQFSLEGKSMTNSAMQTNEQFGGRAWC